MLPLSATVRRLSSRLSIKFLAALLALSFIFLALAIYSVEAGRRALEETIGEESMEDAHQFALAVDRGIYSKLHEIVIISMGRTPMAFINSSNEEFDAMTDPESCIDEQDEEWTSVPVDEITPFMETLLSNNLSIDLRSRLELHYIREHGVRIYGEILVTNKYGAIIAMTSRSTDYRQSDEVWWQNARDQRRYVGDLEYDTSAGMYAIPVCVGVFDDLDNFMGVVKAVVGAAEVITEAQFESEVFETTEVDILTPDLRRIYSTHAYKVFEDVSSEPYVQAIEGASGYYMAEEGGRERMYAYSESPGYIEYEGSTWIFLMSHDMDELMEGVITLRYDILIMSIVLLTAFVAVTLALSRSVTVPVQKLKLATRRMAEGHMDERVDISSRDELGELAQAFNNMASELGEFYEDLEAKVQERTKELEAANAKLNILGSITRHDALNQLSVLRGWLSVLEEDHRDTKTLEYFEKMRQATETLESQLKFTGMYEKVGITRPEWVGARLAVDTSMPGLDLKGAKLINRFQGLEVYADPMFPRVLRNLADNAVKHGKRTTTVSFTFHDRSDGLVIFVEDDGVGVPEENKERIFERVRDKTTGRPGFGLYLSRAILAITGITIKEVGTPGKGARFEIFVPKGKYRFR